MDTRLQSWDRGNAIPYLIEAQAISLRRRSQHGPSTMTTAHLDALANETEWRDLMSKAFVAPRYDSYITRRFDLERRILREHGLDRPAVVLLAIAQYPVPDLANMRDYADLLQDKLAAECQRAGREGEARSYYWTVAHFWGASPTRKCHRHREIDCRRPASQGLRAPSPLAASHERVG